MKHFLVIPLLLLYMVASTGIMINLHYCGEQIESWALNDKTKGCEDDPCDETDSAKEHNCCKDKAISSKISVEQEAASYFKLAFSPKFIIPHTDCFYPENEQLILAAGNSHSFQAHAPPGSWQSIPLYKLHSSLTYYG